MAILKLARMGHPVLTQPAAPVPDATAPDVRRLIADMVETLEDARALGLAAPQVHVGLRLFIWRGGAGNPIALINPVIEPVGEEIESGWEGCLSIPGLRGSVPRAARVRFAGLDMEGQPIAGEASGLTARILQHEVDHLDGVLYPMRMPDLSLFGFTEELCRAATRAQTEETPS
jgi:peptide deformylase